MNPLNAVGLHGLGRIGGGSITVQACMLIKKKKSEMCAKGQWLRCINALLNNFLIHLKNNIYIYIYIFISKKKKKKKKNT